MPNKKTYKHRPTPKDRKGDHKRRRIKRGLHPRGVPGRGRRRGAANGAPANDQTNILNPKIAPVKLYLLRRYSVFDPETYPQGKIHFILSNLYKVLKHTPGFVDDKEWKELPTLQDLAAYLFSKVRELHEDAWQYKFDEDGVLRFVVYECPPKLDYTHCVPLEWVGAIQLDIGGEMYRVLVATLGLVADKFNLDVFVNNVNDMVIHDTDAYLTGEDDDMFVKLHAASYRKNGAADNFKDEMKREAGKTNLDQLRSDIRKCKNYSGDLKRAIRQWIFLGLKALENPINIEDLYFYEMHSDEYDMDAINASDMYAYTWSFHDRVHYFQENWYESASQGGCPVIGPTIKTEYFPDRMPKVSAKLEHIQALADFLEFGRNLYFKKFDSAYKNFYRAQKTNNVNLLINKF